MIKKNPHRCSYFIVKVLSSGSILWADLIIPSNDIPIIHSKFPLVLHRGCVHAKSLQSCSTLWNPMDHSLPGCSVHGVPQARILEWVAMSSSSGSSQLRDRTCISLHWLTGSLPLAPPEKPFSYPGNSPDPGIRPGSPVLQADSLSSGLPGKSQRGYFLLIL